MPSSCAGEDVEDWSYRILIQAVCGGTSMTRFLMSLLVVSLSISSFAETPKSVPVAATYVVRLVQLNPPKLAVTAEVPMDGKSLNMDTNRSAEVAEVADRGWPGLIKDLQITDHDGRRLTALPKGDAGWELSDAYHGILTLKYQVDYSGPAAHNWPAPRETAFTDPDHFIFVGRSVFITTSATAPAHVKFDLPTGWLSVTPWSPMGDGKESFSAETVDDLVNNLLVLTRSAPDVVLAGEFRVSVIPMGHWETVRTDVRDLLRGVIAYYVQTVGDHQRARYSVVLLPIADSGGESFRSSFAFNVETPPTKSSIVDWGHTIAHEVFHYWNGWRLRGADYQSSQWFQEGFTEYAADRAMLASGFMDPDQFRERLAGYIDNYRKLTTPLAAPGGRKGPPLYSGGALVAFCWDVRIRSATHVRKSLDDFWRALWIATEDGRKPYEWGEIRAALESVMPGDWEAFHQKYVVASEPLPIEQCLGAASLQIDQGSGGRTQVKLSSAATADTAAVWQSLAGQ